MTNEADKQTQKQKITVERKFAKHAAPIHHFHLICIIISSNNYKKPVAPYCKRTQERLVCKLLFGKKLKFKTKDKVKVLLNQMEK